MLEFSAIMVEQNYRRHDILIADQRRNVCPLMIECPKFANASDNIAPDVGYHATTGVALTAGCIGVSFPGLRSSGAGGQEG
jgi:hypothetical protein